MDNCEIECKKLFKDSIISYNSKIKLNDDEISGLVLGEQSKLIS